MTHDVCLYEIYYQNYRPTLIYIYAGMASILPFKAVFQKQLGISTIHNGFIEATFQIVPIVTSPISGIIADKTKAYKLLLGVLLLLVGAFSFPFCFVPAVDDAPGPSQNTSTSCCLYVNGSRRDVVCPQNFSFSDTSNYGAKDRDTIVLDTQMHQVCVSSGSNGTLYDGNKGSYERTFAILVLLTALLAACFAPIIPLLDSSAMDTLGKEHVASFGIQRSWGSVGFGIVGLCIGYLTDVISPPDIDGRRDKNYVLAFCGAGVMWWCATVVMVAFGDISAPKAENLLKNVKKLIMKKEVIFFLFSILIIGFALGMHFSYVYWYLQDFDDFQLAIVGLISLESSIAEIPMFWLAGWICETLGCVSAMSIGLCAYGVSHSVHSLYCSATSSMLKFSFLDSVFRLFGNYRGMANTSNRMAT